MREAAVGLYETFADTDNPNWQRLNKAVLDSLTNELTVDAFTLAFDVIVGAAALTNPVTAVAYGVYQVVRALANLAGFDNKAQAIVKSHVFYAIANGSSKLLNDVIQFTGSNYFEYEEESEEIYTKYAVLLCQARILGLETVKDFLVNGTFLDWLINIFGWSINDGTKQIYDNAINLVKNTAVYFDWSLPKKIEE